MRKRRASASTAPDLPGLQILIATFWRNPGIVTLLDADANILAQEEMIPGSSHLEPVNWRGDGQEFALLSGNVREGGMIDGQLRRVVVFPDDGHPDLASAVRDLTGDARDEIVLWDQTRVWIYTAGSTVQWGQLSIGRLAIPTTTTPTTGRRSRCRRQSGGTDGGQTTGVKRVVSVTAVPPMAMQSIAAGNRGRKDRDRAAVVRPLGNRQAVYLTAFDCSITSRAARPAQPRCYFEVGGRNHATVCESRRACAHTVHLRLGRVAG